MRPEADDMVQKVTTELSAEILEELLLAEQEVVYQPVPHADNGSRVVWRVRFELTFDPTSCIGLDVNGDVTLGRGQDAPDIVTLFSAHDAEHLGVSRRHAALRPTDTHLYLLDLGSTNGTRLNGRSIGVNMPYSLADGDVVTLGHLEFVVRIVKRPAGHTAALSASTDLADMLIPIARAILSHLDRNEVLKQTLEMTMSFTSASEASIWLVDEQTGELFLEAGQGIEENQMLRLPVADTLAGKVVKTGQPLRAHGDVDGEQVKVKTGYLVEAVIYVPLTLGGVTFGVLSAAHHKAGKRFNQREEKLMTAIADLTAIAVQNARLYEATDNALARRVKVVTALNYALSYDLKNLVNSTIGYAGLMETCDSLDEESAEIANRIAVAGDQMAHLIDKLIEVTALSEESPIHHVPCDLVEAVSRAVDDLRDAAAAKSIDVNFQLVGDPYWIKGDATHLYRSVSNLVDNAIRYSPPDAHVSVTLGFWYNDIVIRVCDTGPGIPEDDLPYLFDKYFRGKRSPDGQGGIGLGLELVRATVEAHRGTVVARNVEDHGAEFIITLPTTLRVS